MEVDYWTDAKVTHARRETSGPNKGKWQVTVVREDKDRVLYVDHVVFAIGVGGGTPNMPKIPGMVRRFRFFLFSSRARRSGGC